MVVAAVAAVTASGCDGPEPEPAETGTASAAQVVADGGIPRGSTWSYWSTGGELGTAWRAPAYDDTAWPRGSGPLGYGESYLATTIPYGQDPGAKPITTYFRSQFTLTDPTAVIRLTGSLMYDDGIVVYLNGHEIGRELVPTPTTSATRAGGHEAGNAYLVFDWTAQRTHLVAGVNTVAVEVHQQAPSSSDLVFDLGLVLELSAPPPSTAGGIPRGATWTYWDRGGDLGAAWRGPAFDDAAWSNGAAPLGYGEPYLTTMVGYGPSAASKYVTTYVRADFTVVDPAAVTAIAGELMYDDGVVVYLNGHEIGRQGVATPTTAATLASGHEAGNRYEAFDWSAQRSRLVAGVNTVAVEVHQQAPSSSDLAFDLSLRLTIVPATPPPEDTPRRSTWSYWDGGGDLGTAWRGRTFDDTGWRRGAGPLGYGEPYVATTLSFGADASHKHVTTYFRRHFTVHNAFDVESFVGDIMYDDGVVIYLNGTEIKRLHMPAGPVTAATLATGWETGNAYESYQLGDFGLLVEGDNVIAVEVHQAAPTSSDLTFDMALTLDSTCWYVAPGDWQGTSGEMFRGAGGSSEERADVTWHLARTDGCVDHYTPTGTAYVLESTHICYEVDPPSHPIAATDGELIIDRSGPPMAYTVRGSTAWDGMAGCRTPEPGEEADWHPVRLTSNWADHAGTFDRDVISGGYDDGGHSIAWDFRPIAASFPPPAAGACVEPASDQWRTVSGNGRGSADITWTRVATTGCRDEYEPAGTAHGDPVVDASPTATCRVRRWVPDASPVGADDGYLLIDRSTNPPTFTIQGITVWSGDQVCERPDGTVTTSAATPAVSWGDFLGAYHGDVWSGVTDGGNRRWRFERP